MTESRHCGDRRGRDKCGRSHRDESPFGHYLVPAEPDVPLLDPDALLLGSTLNDIKSLGRSDYGEDPEPEEDDGGGFRAARRYLIRTTYTPIVATAQAVA